MPVLSQMLLPNIKRDGHHGVQDDDIGPEHEEGREASTVSILSWQEGCELRAYVQLPDVVSYCQDGAHKGQETKNLREKFSEFRGSFRNWRRTQGRLEK